MRSQKHTLPLLAAFGALGLLIGSCVAVLVGTPMDFPSNGFCSGNGSLVSVLVLVLGIVATLPALVFVALRARRRRAFLSAAGILLTALVVQGMGLEQAHRYRQRVLTECSEQWH